MHRKFVSALRSLWCACVVYSFLRKENNFCSTLVQCICVYTCIVHNNVVKQLRLAKKQMCGCHEITSQRIWYLNMLAVRHCSLIMNLSQSWTHTNWYGTFSFTRGLNFSTISVNTKISTRPPSLIISHNLSSHLTVVCRIEVCFQESSLTGYVVSSGSFNYEIYAHASCFRGASTSMELSI